jgi:hypothetical protein
MSAHAFVEDISKRISSAYAGLSTRSLTRYVAILLGAIVILCLTSYSVTSDGGVSGIKQVYKQISGSKKLPVLGPLQYRSDGSAIPLNYTKVATMIELRDLPQLQDCLLNFLTVAPKDWPFVIWLSEDNIEAVRNAVLLQPDIRSGRLNLTVMPQDSIVDGGDSLTHFLTRPWFWNQFHPLAEWMLFFQEDSVLCAKSPDSIDNWLGYDWVGGNTFWQEEGKGGNGGLSMRKLSTLKFITENIPNKYNVPEDVWFMRTMLSLQRRNNDYTSVPFPGEVVFPVDHKINQGLFSLEVWNDDAFNIDPRLMKPLGCHTYVQ